GFIGAGNVGFSLGKYFADHDLDVVGYFSEDKKDSLEAADFTNSKSYDSVDEILADSDVLFLTVPDDSIERVWKQLNSSHFTDKIICHTSGVHSSEIFSGLGNHSSYGYSIHPLCTINDKYKSYKGLSNIYFTIEGDEEKLDEVSNLFLRLGNKINLIKAEDKARYHLAAAVASNLVVGLVDMAERVIPHDALVPIMKANMNHIIEEGTVGALTGPIERGDVSTIKKHLAVLKESEIDAYKSVSKQVLKVAKKKNPDRDYTEIEELLQ
ncbi:MAG: DUF2520 domain-containing protein, partial [Eubacterium sp.]|nr:DUF2520 domain-containing protein [Eubacterium sp.]